MNFPSWLPTEAREWLQQKGPSETIDHDFRSTVRTGLTGWAGIYPDMVERTIHHQVGGVRSVYEHADYRPHVAQEPEEWNWESSRI